jgi:hypothetical protein
LEIGLRAICAPASSHRHHNHRDDGAGADQRQAGARQLGRPHTRRTAGLEGAALLAGFGGWRWLTRMGGMRPHHQKSRRQQGKYYPHPIRLFVLSDYFAWQFDGIATTGRISQAALEKPLCQYDVNLTIETLWETNS